MSTRTWFIRTGRRRAASEAGLAVLALVLPLAATLLPWLALDWDHGAIPESQSIWPLLGIGLAYAGYFGGLLGAVRVRKTGGGVRQQLRYELANAAAIIVAIWAGALLAHLVAAAWVVASGPLGRAEGELFSLRAPILAAASAAAAVLAYPLCRGAVLAWPVWNRLRGRRLLWALTHGQLVGALALAAGVAAFSMTFMGGRRFGPPFGPDLLPSDASVVATLLAWLTTRLLPALTELLVLGVAAAALLLPPAALISFLVLRRTTRRLEELAAAAGALRAGNLAARVPVDGQDEVGRLQADFNAMAADLERTLGELQGERDRVAGLLEARRQLVASVSHELRTPVATVRGYLESALRRGGSPRAVLWADLETMEQEVERLQRLIEDLFALSRAEVGRLELRLEPTDVGAVVHRLVSTLAPLAWQQRRVQMLAEVVSALPPARADAERLEQVASNLLSNAVRHTPPGGLVAAAVSADANFVRVEVRDTGEGIATEDLPHVFERFYRGSSDGERRDGAGLGLALVKELTEAMGGSAEAASRPGEGSCFTVRLPRV